MYKVILPRVLKHIPDETQEDVIEVLLWEIGDIAKCIHHMRRFPADKELYKAELKKAVADALTQLRILCEMNDWKFGELLQLGYESLLTTLQERFPCST